jgi:hypothetical protein
MREPIHVVDANMPWASGGHAARLLALGRRLEAEPLPPPAPASAGVAPEGAPLLCRTGYATALYALGRRLDRQQAIAIAISEGEQFVAVSMQPAGSGAPREELYLADDLAHLISQVEHERLPLRLRSAQGAPAPEPPTQHMVMQARAERARPVQRRPHEPRLGQLHRFAARLMSGVRQQPGG